MGAGKQKRDPPPPPLQGPRENELINHAKRCTRRTAPAEMLAASILVAIDVATIFISGLAARVEALRKTF